MELNNLGIWLKVGLPAAAMVFIAINMMPAPKPSRADLERIIAAAKGTKYDFGEGKLGNYSCGKTNSGSGCSFVMVNNEGEQISDEIWIKLVYQNKTWVMPKR